MTHKEVLEMLNILKESSENTVGNRIDKKQSYTILSGINPSSFSYVIDQAINEIRPTRKTGLYWVERFDNEAKWLECI